MLGKIRSSEYALLLSVLLTFGSVRAQPAAADRKQIFEADIGYSAYLVDPDVHLSLRGVSFELKYLSGRRTFNLVAPGLSKSRELTLTCSTVLRGDIEATALGVAIGRRYEFSRWHFGFGVGPFSYLLLSGKKTDPRTGYTLDTGLRLHVYYLIGLKIPFAGRDLVLNGKYHFTVKDVYLHNPFAVHKHADIFHYFTVSLGVMK